MARKKLASTSTPTGNGGTATLTAPAAPTIKAPVTVAAAPAKPQAANWPVTKPSHDQIAKRAYEIWIARGRPVGSDLENWQQAERELGVR